MIRYTDAQKKDILLEAARVGKAKTAKLYGVHINTLNYWSSKIMPRPKKEVLLTHGTKNTKKPKITLKVVEKPKDQILSKNIKRKILAVDKAMERVNTLTNELKSMIDFS